MSLRLPLLLLAAVAAAGDALAQQCPEPPGAPPPAAAAEPGLALQGPEGLPIEITSGGAEVSRQGDARLSGGVTVRQGDRTLSADAASYDAETSAFDVEGDVTYRAPDLRIRGSGGNWMAGGGGRFRGAEFELPSRPARGSADELQLTAAGDLAMRGVRYTACPAGHEDWLLRAESIDIDQRRQQGTGRNVRVELKGIPILYAPLISFPVGDSRKSGFLFPSFGTSNRSGVELGLPYYFNLAPNYDLKLEPRLLSRRGGSLRGEFRYLSERSHGRLDANLLPSDDVAGRDRAFGSLWHQTDFSDALRLQANLQQASDSRWFEDFGLGPAGTSVTFLDRYVELSYLGRGWRFDGRLQDFQTIDVSVDPDTRPYSRLPQLLLRGAWPARGTGLVAGVDAEFVWFDRDTGTTGARLDVAPRLSWPMRGAGWFLEPSAAWRLTAYELDELPVGADDSPSRSAPVLSADAGLVFERLGRRGLLQTLEPRLRYTWIPFREQDGLPLFDTALPDLNLVQLFRANRYVGADRLGDANELAAGITTRLIDPRNGQQFLSATLGQRFFFERPRVALPGEPAGTRSASNLVGELELRAYRHWSLALAMEWDPDESNTVLGQASIQYRPRPDTVVNAGYRYREGRLEQWDASVAWRLSPSWQLFARQVYSLREKTSIDSFAGFEYGGCCWRIRLLGRRYISNRTGQHDTSVILQLELRGLSSVGTSDEAFLRRGIRGYSPDPAAPLP